MKMIRKKFKAYRSGHKLSSKGWENTLMGVPAFIIGNAPSLESLNLDCLKNQFTIGINRAFYKIDPTILMWQDPELWYSEKHRIPKLKCIKYCRDSADIQGRFYHFKLSNGYYRFPESAEILYGHGSTGPLAFQLAHLLGCNPIVMLGMDCKYSNGKTDFYGKNPCHKPHTLTNCRKGLQWIKSVKHDRILINCSESDIFNEKHSFLQVAKSISTNTPMNRDSLISRILRVG